MLAVSVVSGRMHRLAGVTAALEIRELRGRPAMEALLACFDEVWQLAPGARPMSTEFLLALGHAGAPVLGAFVGEVMVGASVAVTGVRPDGTTVMHSHMTGVAPGLQHHGVGRQLKWAQRQWAADRGVHHIEWTFDPLVRRNGWFNLNVLGAAAPEYLVDFYGPIDDGINAGDETDRLLAVWPVTEEPMPVKVHVDDVLVPTPPDIVTLRRDDPTEARRWRLRLRRLLKPLLAGGWSVVAMTPDGDYVVREVRERQ